MVREIAKYGGELEKYLDSFVIEKSERLWRIEMAKSKSFYICNECGYKTSKWVGKCDNCDAWGVLKRKLRWIHLAEE